MGRLEDLTNKKFGRLTVLRRVENYNGSSDSRAQWLAVCECNSTVIKCTRDFKRVGTRNTCPVCEPIGAKTSNKRSFKYAKNINGFTDRKTIVYES